MIHKINTLILNIIDNEYVMILRDNDIYHINIYLD